MKVYRRVLGPVYDNEKEIWRIFTDKEMYFAITLKYKGYFMRQVKK
jgi:hypothetical protein